MSSAAVNGIQKFKWDKLMKSVQSPDVMKSLGVLRGKTSEVLGQYMKEDKKKEPIDFEGYKKKLQFTSAGVDILEKHYKSVNIPQYSADLPEFEKVKRTQMQELLSKSVAVAQKELAELKTLRDNYDDELRFHKDSTFDDFNKRFPDIARSNEDELNQMLFMHNKAETRQLLADAHEDTDEAHCRYDGSQYAGDYGFKFKNTFAPVEGEDSYVAQLDYVEPFSVKFDYEGHDSEYTWDHLKPEESK